MALCARLVLLLGVWACAGDHPLRLPPRTGSLTCKTHAFPVPPFGRSDTLLRFWSHGKDDPVRPRPSRLLEALYDSTGQPRIVASLTEPVAHSAQLEILAVDFRANAVRGERFKVAPDSAEYNLGIELRAYRRFNRPAFMSTIIGKDTIHAGVVRESVVLTDEDVKSARLLAVELWSLRCPWVASMPSPQRCQWNQVTRELTCQPGPDP